MTSGLWTVDVERDVLNDSMFATIYCDPQKGGCGYAEKAVFRGRSAKCPKCGQAALGVSAFNQRNAIVADAAERFAFNLFNHIVNNSTTLSGKFFVKRSFACPQPELWGATFGDIIILNRDINGPVSLHSIACIFEIKMSIIWNWREADKSHPVADYDAHAGRPSIYRTDSVLKATKKAAIARRCPGSERIPFIVVGNTPPPPNHRDEVDGTVKAGLIQKWGSLTPNPLIVESMKSPARRNPKQTTGFLRIDSTTELEKLLRTTLTHEWRYIGAMVEAKKVGEIIKGLDLSRTPEEIGHDFLRQRLQQAPSRGDG